MLKILAHLPSVCVRMCVCTRVCVRACVCAGGLARRVVYPLHHSDSFFL